MLQDLLGAISIHAWRFTDGSWHQSKEVSQPINEHLTENAWSGSLHYTKVNGFQGALIKVSSADVSQYK